MNWRAKIPWSMVGCRAALGAAIAVAGHMAHPQAWLGAMIAAGFLSDVCDGILARRWGTETPALRMADSAADTIFYMGVLAAIIERHWIVLRDRWALLAVLLTLEVLRALFDWIKFRRMASYHSYAAKAWGILLALAVLAALCFDRGYWLVTIALAWGIVCDLEGLVMSMLLPEWTHDVKSLPRALTLRRQMRAAHGAAIR
jgi:CDP-diacylglycerol--glycerol-3-phosphate 3-phosphatidyltransferase